MSNRCGPIVKPVWKVAIQRAGKIYFGFVTNTTAYRLGQLHTSSPRTKELHPLLLLINNLVYKLTHFV